MLLEDIYLNPGVTKGNAYLGARLTGQPNIFDVLDKRQHSRERSYRPSTLGKVYAVFRTDRHLSG